MQITDEVRRKLLGFQRNEITEHHIYSKLAATIKSEHNRRILEQIAADELRHYGVWKGYTGQDVAPRRFLIFLALARTSAASSLAPSTRFGAFFNLLSVAERSGCTGVASALESSKDGILLFP